MLEPSTAATPFRKGVDLGRKSGTKEKSLGLSANEAVGLSDQGGHALIPPTGNEVELRYDNQRAVVVELGAGLRSYTVGARKIIDGYGPDEPCTAGRGQLLIPWPNRLQDGAYSFGGRDFQLPKSEPDLGNAIHGLTRWSSWSVANRAPDQVTMTHVIYPQEGYPFTVSLAVRYALSLSGLKVTVSATNAGCEPCPYGAGAHPYLAAGVGLIDDDLLCVPASTMLVTDERSIPISSVPVQTTQYDYRELREVGRVHLDTCYTDLERGPDGIARVVLEHRGRDWTTVLWVDGSFSYIMVFTGDTLSDPDARRRGIAVEPMTCAPNAFRSGDGLQILGPGESTSGSWGIDHIADGNHGTAGLERSPLPRLSHSVSANRWQDPDHARAYLTRLHEVPHRLEGEEALLDLLPVSLSRVLDLGTGDGRLLKLVKEAFPACRAVALDFSPTMLAAVGDAFAGDGSVVVMAHDLDSKLPGDIGRFDAIISSFAIHHLEDQRKIALFTEIAAALEPGGVFCNLEHVTTSNARLHREFLDALGVAPGEEDPSNRLASVGDQIQWLRTAGLVEVDCYWKWRELALIAGWRAGVSS